MHPGRRNGPVRFRGGLGANIFPVDWQRFLCRDLPLTQIAGWRGRCGSGPARDSAGGGILSKKVPGEKHSEILRILTMPDLVEHEMRLQKNVGAFFDLLQRHRGVPLILAGSDEPLLLPLHGIPYYGAEILSPTSVGSSQCARPPGGAARRRRGHHFI